MLNNLYQEATEPAISCVATNRVNQILDAKYEKANLPKVVKDNCGHLNVQQRNNLLQLLIQYEELFDSTLGDWQDKLVSFVLKKRLSHTTVAQFQYRKSIEIPSKER